MALSFPSFLAAATRASMPPRSAAEVAVAAFLSPDPESESEPQAERQSAAAAMPTTKVVAARARWSVTGFLLEGTTGEAAGPHTSRERPDVRDSLRESQLPVQLHPVG